MWQHASSLRALRQPNLSYFALAQASTVSARRPSIHQLSQVLGYTEYVVGIRKEESCIPQIAFRWQAPHRARSSQSVWWWASCCTSWSSPGNPTTPWTARTKAGMAMKMSMITCHTLPIQTCEKSVLIAAVSEDSRKKKQVRKQCMKLTEASSKPLGRAGMS
jgi:hypothetical protein